MGAEIAVEVELDGVGSGGLRGEAGEDGDWSFCKGLLGRRKLRESVLRVIPVFIYSIEFCVCGSLKIRTLNEKIGADWMQVTVFVGSSSLEVLKTRVRWVLAAKAGKKCDTQMSK